MSRPHRHTLVTHTHSECPVTIVTIFFYDKNIATMAAISSQKPLQTATSTVFHVSVSVKQSSWSPCCNAHTERKSISHEICSQFCFVVVISSIFIGSIVHIRWVYFPDTGAIARLPSSSEITLKSMSEIYLYKTITTHIKTQTLCTWDELHTTIIGELLLLFVWWL